MKTKVETREINCVITGADMDARTVTIQLPQPLTPTGLEIGQPIAIHPVVGSSRLVSLPLTDARAILRVIDKCTAPAWVGLGKDANAIRRLRGAVRKKADDRGQARRENQNPSDQT